MRLPPRPLLLGHRGASADAPENTLRAFRLALEQGADGVEFDVQPSADGVPVVIHDDTVERTTDGKGRVGALPWHELARLDAGAGERIPRLDEVADWAAQSGAWLNLELKAPGAEAASVEILHRTGVADRTIVSSFAPAVLEEVRRLAPRLRRYFLTEYWDVAAREAASRCGAHGICLADRAATPAALRELAESARPVVVWTVDDPARIAELLSSGVAALITNVPAHAAAAARPSPPNPA